MAKTTQFKHRSSEPLTLASFRTANLESMFDLEPDEEAPARQPMRRAAVPDDEELLPGLAPMPSRSARTAGRGFGKRVLVQDAVRQFIADPMQKPYNGILMLLYEFDNGQTFQGTGWLIHPRLAITAGHVIRDQKNGMAKSRNMRALQGVNGDVRRAREFPAAEIKTTNGWIASGGTRTDFDFGAVFFDRDIDGHFFEATVKEPASVLTADKDDIWVVGYPSQGSAQVDGVDRMHADSGKVTGLSPENLVVFYNIDTTEGQSGAPVIFFDRAARKFQVIAIHSGGHSSAANQGVFVTDRIADTLQSWIDHADE
jgi:V8-like Glu-specific endopeptidase